MTTTTPRYIVRTLTPVSREIREPHQVIDTQTNRIINAYESKRVAEAQAQAFNESETTMTETTTWTLRAGRELTERGGYGVKRQLRTMQNSAGVFWSQPHANSYVCVLHADGYRVLSINGIGEVRWEVNPADLGWSGDSSARDAVAYFLEVQQ